MTGSVKNLGSVPASRAMAKSNLEIRGAVSQKLASNEEEGKS